MNVRGSDLDPNCTLMINPGADLCSTPAARRAARRVEHRHRPTAQWAVDLHGCGHDVQRFRLPHRRVAIALVVAGVAGGLALVLVSREEPALREGLPWEKVASFAGDISRSSTRNTRSATPTSWYLDLRANPLLRRAHAREFRAPGAFERVLPERPELSYLLRHVPDPSRENLLTAGEKKLIERWILEARRGRPHPAASRSRRAARRAPVPRRRDRLGPHAVARDCAGHARDADAVPRPDHGRARSTCRRRSS